MNNKGLLLIAGLTSICVVIQLLSVISVPITGQSTGYHLNLSLYHNYTFGVFGICDLQTGVCSSPLIGYPSKDSAFYILANDEGFDDILGGVELPSKTTYTISMLLVVHVVGLCFTAVLFLVAAGLLAFFFFEEKLIQAEAMAVHLSRNGSADVLLGAAEQQMLASVKRPKKDITIYLNVMLVVSLLSFVLTLLAFLADILLFIPRLSWLGWLQLLPLVVLAMTASMLCFIKRSVSSRRYLDDYRIVANNDMRPHKNIESSWREDTASDDGFYVYTNGFYSNYNDAGEVVDDLVPRHGPNWVRHGTNADDTSMAGENMEPEDIELQTIGSTSNQH